MLIFYDHLNYMLYIISETGEIKNKVQFDMDKYQIPENQFIIILFLKNIKNKSCSLF